MSIPSISCVVPALTAQQKMLIAYCVTHQPQYGQVTRFAEKFDVSRQTIYNIKNAFLPAIDRTDAASSYEVSKAEVKKKILSLRMEGRCPIAGIEKILQREQAVCTSVGFISETLTEWGALAGRDLDCPMVGETMSVVYATDEIYAGSAPILIVVEPRSMAILRISLCDDRSTASWVEQFSALTAQSVRSILTVKDEGNSMKAAVQQLLPDVAAQSDTFHAVAHRLGDYKRQYELTAYRAIQAEYDAETQYYKAKSPETREKYCNTYCEARRIADAAIALYDDFCYLYHHLLRAFQVFDQHGNLKNIPRLIADFTAALDLLLSLEHPNPKKITAHIQSIRACQSTLFTFLYTAQTVVQKISQTIAPWVLKPLCRAWQARKNALKAKNKSQKQIAFAQEKTALAEAEYLQPHDNIARKDQVYAQLNTIVQSSAAVECINSLLRPYLNNARNHVSQAFLNLFMFYHNHHAFDQGERKGKSPMQILTGLPQTDWIDLLAQKANR